MIKFRNTAQRHIRIPDFNEVLRRGELTAEHSRFIEDCQRAALDYIVILLDRPVTMLQVLREQFAEESTRAGLILSILYFCPPDKLGLAGDLLLQSREPLLLLRVLLAPEALSNAGSADAIIRPRNVKQFDAVCALLGYMLTQESCQKKTLDLLDSLRHVAPALGHKVAVSTELQQRYPLELCEGDRSFKTDGMSHLQQQWVQILAQDLDRLYDLFKFKIFQNLDRFEAQMKLLKGPQWMAERMEAHQIPLSLLADQLAETLASRLKIFVRLNGADLNGQGVAVQNLKAQFEKLSLRHDVAEKIFLFYVGRLAVLHSETLAQSFARELLRAWQELCEGTYHRITDVQLVKPEMPQRMATPVDPAADKDFQFEMPEDESTVARVTEDGDEAFVMAAPEDED